MAINSLSFNQVATILNAIQQQVTGRTSIAALTAADFATSADITLKAGYEAVYNAIGTVLGRTIFSTRPYTRKFRGLELTDTEFKFHTRKLQIVDNAFEDNQTMEWPAHYDSTKTSPDDPYGNGASVDQQKIKKHEIVQTNFYGMNTYQDHYTIFDEQLDVAFSSPEELGRFFSMIITNVSNMFEQSRENFARATLVNYAGALYANGPTRAINLLAEYNSVSGGSYTTQTIYAPANFPGFMKWAFARIKQICGEMTERSIKYQNSINGKWITRHTPYEDQRIFIYAPDMYATEASVLSSVFNDSYLKRSYTEEVSFWQNINSPSAINVTPTAMGSNGVPVVASNVQLGNVYGIICDRDAVGYSVVRSTMKAAPYNAAADYRNFFLKDYQKNFNDISEKGVLLYLADS